MTAILQNLINALREELQQYGEMLALLDCQSEIGRSPGSDDLLQSISSINAQSAIIQLSRQSREDWQRQLTQHLELAEGANFAEILPRLPEPYRPLVVALVQENNQLLSRVRERAEENRILLRRTLEMLQQFLSSLARPDHTGLATCEETDVIAELPGDSVYQAIA
jgi:hypothetical protein